MGARQGHPVVPSTLVRRAFTVVELLVVIVIILIVLTIATPAFRALIYSSERSLAFNSVEAAVAAARDLALRSAGGDDGAVVFLFDQGGPVRILPAVRIGTINEPAESGRLDAVGSIRLDIFAPIPDVPTVELPRNWHVRGYAPAGSMVDLLANGDPFVKWYNSPTTGGTNQNAAAKKERNWIFPESGFYATDFQVAPGQGNAAGVRITPNAPTARQSFMIRFDARSGGVSADRGLALFLDPRPSVEDRPGDDRPRANVRWLRPDRAEDLAAWARRIIASPPFDGQSGNAVAPPYEARDDERGKLLFVGSLSNDTVLVKPVSRIAVYDERRLATAVGARSLNRETNSLYKAVAHDNSGSPAQVMGLDNAIFQSGFNPDDVRQKINSWIEGDTNFDGVIDLDDEPEARIYLVRPSSGDLTEVVR